MEATCNYELILDSFKNLHINAVLLEEIKLFFQNQIGSNRRFALIRSLEDLLDALERRDIINEYNMSVLEEIGSMIGCADLMMGISQYEPPYKHHTDVYNEYAFQRIQEEEQLKQFNNLKINFDEPEEAQIYPRVPPVPSVNFMNKSVFEQKREIIYRYICDNIGRKWRAFGRELQIREGEMDDLEHDYVGNSKERNRKMLQIIEDEERIDPRRIAFLICNALKESGRDDMRYHIEEILSR